MIAMITAIAVIATIGTSVNAENAVLCTTRAKRKCRENNRHPSICAEWAGAGAVDRLHSAPISEDGYGAVPLCGGQYNGQHAS